MGLPAAPKKKLPLPLALAPTFSEKRTLTTHRFWRRFFPRDRDLELGPPIVAPVDLWVPSGFGSVQRAINPENHGRTYPPPWEGDGPRGRL